ARGAQERARGRRRAVAAPGFLSSPCLLAARAGQPAERAPYASIFGSMSEIPFQDIERRWQERWARERVFEPHESDPRTPVYCIEMLPYPSGRLHMGHVRNYTIGDALAWFRRMQGYNVLHPMGWDSLGLPAENAAIQRGADPREWTLANIAAMKAQMRRLGFS